MRVLLVRAGSFSDGGMPRNSLAGGDDASVRASSVVGMTVRAPLDPAVAAVRLASRRALASHPDAPVIVGVSGGADSLALAAAVAFEAPKLGIRAVAVTVDHGLQTGSDAVAAAAARTCSALGLEARVIPVRVEGSGGPEAAARDARRRALRAAAVEIGARSVLLAHTLDDQAETVLLGLARGAGAASLAGMAGARIDGEGVRWVRPLLELRRADTVAACAAQGLEPWHDPHNDDVAFARVRARRRVLPVLEAELGPGVAEALARTADQLREDDEAFRDMIEEIIEDIVEHAEAGIAISVPALAANPAALRHRVIRHVVASEFGVSLSRAQTLEVARLVTDWSGQGPIDLPGCRAQRIGARLTFAARA
jgi:tRNA(Ile)-lysidine synthase